MDRFKSVGYHGRRHRSICGARKERRIEANGIGGHIILQTHGSVLMYHCTISHCSMHMKGKNIVGKKIFKMSVHVFFMLSAHIFNGRLWIVYSLQIRRDFHLLQPKLCQLNRQIV